MPEAAALCAEDQELWEALTEFAAAQAEKLGGRAEPIARDPGELESLRPSLEEMRRLLERHHGATPDGPVRTESLPVMLREIAARLRARVTQ